MDDCLPLASLKRKNIDAGILIPFAGRHGKQDGLAAWKNLRPVVPHLALSQFCYRRWRPAHRWNSLKTPPYSASCLDDIPVVPPASRSKGEGIAKGDWRAARCRNLPELPVAEKSDPLAIWRKERRACILCASQRYKCFFIKPPCGETDLAVGIKYRGGEARSIRRDRQMSSRLPRRKCRFRVEAISGYLDRAQFGADAYKRPQALPTGAPPTHSCNQSK